MEHIKKYCKSIGVCWTSIKDVLEIPIVNGIRKEREERHYDGYCDAYSLSQIFILDVEGYDIPLCPVMDEITAYLALDVCGNWHAFSVKQWEEHKNDEIYFNK